MRSRNIITLILASAGSTLAIFMVIWLGSYLTLQLSTNGIGMYGGGISTRLLVNLLVIVLPIVLLTVFLIVHKHRN